MSRSRRRSSAMHQARSTSTAVAPRVQRPARSTSLSQSSPDPTPFLDQAASLLGAEEGAEAPSWSVGGAGPEQAATQRDGHIHVNPEVAETGADLGPLMAHEAVHAAQARKSGAPAPVGLLEEEADAGAEALLQGRPFEVEHAAAPGQALNFDLRSWFKDTFGSDEEAGASEDKASGDADSGEAAGSEAPVSAPLGVAGESSGPEKPGLRERFAAWRHSKSAEGKWEAKAEATTPKDDSLYVIGKHKHEVPELKVGGEAKRSGNSEFGDVERRKMGVSFGKGKPGDRTMEKVSSEGPQGRESYKTEAVTRKKDKVVGTKDTEEVFDLHATAKDAGKALESRKGEHQAQKGQIESEIDGFDREIARRKRALAELGASPTPGEGGEAAVGGETGGSGQDAARKKKALEEEIRGLQAKKAKRLKDRDAVAKKITEIDQDKARLASSPEALEAVVSKHKVQVDKRYKKTTEEHTKGLRKKDWKKASTYTDPTLTHEDTRKKTVEIDDKKVVSTHAKERTGSLKKGSLTFSESHSRVEENERADFAGKDTTSFKTDKKTEVGLWGADGARIGHSRSQERKGLNGSERKESSGGKVSYKGGKLAADASSSSRVKDVHGNVSESERSGRIGPDGASGKVSSTDGHEGQHRSAKVKRSASGDFTVKVTQVSKDPPKYQLVTTITVGAEVAGELAGKKNGDASREDAWQDGDGNTKIKGSAKVGGSASYTHTRTLSKADADAYLGQVDKVDAGGKASGHPEFSFWAKAKAIAKEGTGVSKLAGAVGSSDSAAGMSEGDSFSLELSGTAGAGIDGEISGGGVGVGAGASAEGTVKRTLSVARGKGGRVTVTVGFSTASKLKGTLSASSGMAKGGVEASKGSGSGESVSFELNTDDPRYAEKYRAISTTLRPDTLRSLRETYKKDAVAVTRTRSRNESAAGHVDVKGARFDVGDRSAYKEQVKVGKDGASGSFEGSGGQGAGVSVAGVKLAGADDSTSVKADVGEDGSVDVDIEDKSTENSLGLPDDLRVPLDADEAKKLLKLKENVQKAETRLSGYRLSGSDLDALIGRAGDRNNWAKCASLHPRAFGAWMGLAGQLRSPRVDPEWAEVEPDQAKRLARARALAGFAERAGTDGSKILENALRRWGQDTFGGNDPTGKALGEAYEWPPGITQHKATFFKTAKEVTAFETRIPEWVSQDDGLQKELAALGRINDTLVVLQQAVLGCNDFDEPAVRAEILRNLSQRRTRMREHHTSFMTKWAERSGSEVDADKLMANDAGARVRDLHGILRSLKADETRMLGAAEKELGGTFFVDKNEVILILGRVDSSYTLWKKHVQELRTAYIAAEIPADRHQVPPAGASSPGPLMPDVARYTKLLKQAYNHDDAKAKSAGKGSQLERDAQRFESRKKELSGF